MASRVILHIGLMKSGTTFLQGRLDANRQSLQEQGILFPGPGWQDQVHGLVEFFGFTRSMRPTPGAWSELRAQIDDHQGLTIISLELLAAVVRPNIERLVDDFRGTPISVVATVRDLGRNVPAMWQESLKNRYTYSWPEYVAGVRDRVGDAGNRVQVDVCGLRSAAQAALTPLRGGDDRVGSPPWRNPRRLTAKSRPP